MGLKESLEQYALSLDDWLKKAKKASRDVQRLLIGVQTGEIRKIEQLRQTASESCNTANLAAHQSQPFIFETEAYLKYGGGYAEELKAVASQAGVKMYEGAGIIFCYPVLVRLEPNQMGVRIDKKLYQRLNPAYIVKILSKLQTKGSSGNPARFIEALFEAYNYLRAKKGPKSPDDLPLKEIYEILTILPGVQQTYSEIDFIRDIYFLDGSDIKNTRSGHRIFLPASTSSRQSKSVYRFVTREGVEKVYAHIKFTKSE